MNKKTKIIVSALSLIVVVGLVGAVIWGVQEQNASMDAISDLQTQEPVEKEEYIVPPIERKEEPIVEVPVVESEIIEPTAPAEPTEENIIVKEQPKFEKPTLPEDQADTTDKEEPPVYEHEKPKEPEGGSTNDKGEVYVPGFGWQQQTGESIVNHVEIELTGEQVGIM